MGLEKKKKKKERERDKGKCQVSEMPLFIDVTGIFSLSNYYYWYHLIFIIIIIILQWYVPTSIRDLKQRVTILFSR